MNVLLLHPGAMGATVGKALMVGGHGVSWVSAGRSHATISRADAAGLAAVHSLKAGLGTADAVVSVCPPASALSLAQVVSDSGFRGLYVDCNAVSARTMEGVTAVLSGPLVDGGIIGPPAHKSGTTRLYLSGDGAREVAGWFVGSPLHAIAIEGGIGAASTLKMAYAAYTKGSSALLLACAALAERGGVSRELFSEWDLSQPGLAGRLTAVAVHTAPKAWRFSGEMLEIAQSFEQAGLPPGFHESAAELFERIASLKDEARPDLAAVMAALLSGPE